MSWIPQLLTAVLLWSAQDPYTLKVEVPVVSVDVVVTDSRNSLLNDLTKEDFEILEDGTPQEIRFFSPVSAPYNVFLLFDRSGSTKNNWTFMQNAVVKFIEGLRPQDRVALGSFDEPFDVHVRWTADRTMIVSGLDKVVRNRESNGTRFYSALDRTLKNEFKNVTGRRAIVVLTDGKDTDLAFETDRDLRRVLKTSQEARIPIYIIALEDERDKYVILDTAKRYLHDIRENMLELADRSGGRLVFSKRLEDIAPLYEDIARGLGTSYSLGYVPSKGVAGAHHRIEVKAKRERSHITQSRSDYIAR